MRRPLTIAVAGAMCLIVRPPLVRALPTMIRLGYIDCATCHYAPQGGGPLNPYGRGIDEAQSLRAGEYRPRDNAMVRALSWNGRIAQDLRLVLPLQGSWAERETSGSFRARLHYRNFTELPRGFAVHVTVTGETEPAPATNVSYSPGPRSSSPVVNVALLRYRISPTLELYAGRDGLPNGINISDRGTFIRQRNRGGPYNAPAQVNLHWAGERHRVVPFAYGPGGNEAPGERESGVGMLAEIDPTGNRRAMVGLNALRGSSRNGARRLVGAHARLGFGPWGVLAEHDITFYDRSDFAVGFRQHASYAQGFWAIREWLVGSAIAERLSVQEPFEERLNSARLELAARLTSVASISVGAGAQWNLVTRRASASGAVQVTLKTVY
jgi:hypothetical protein